jgi:hypothetical protein
MFWDIEDEQICKSILLDNNNLDRLKEKHGSEYIVKTIKYYTDLGLLICNSMKEYNKSKGIIYLNTCDNAIYLYRHMKKQNDIKVYIYISIITNTFMYRIL